MDEGKWVSVPFTMGSSEESRASSGEAVGGNVLAEVGEVKDGGIRGEEVKSLTSPFWLGQVLSCFGTFYSN